MSLPISTTPRTGNSIPCAAWPETKRNGSGNDSPRPTRILVHRNSPLPTPLSTPNSSLTARAPATTLPGPADTKSTYGHALHSAAHSAHANNPSTRIIADRQRLSCHERALRGFWMGVRDLTATVVASGARLAAGTLLVHQRSCKLSYGLLGGISLFHMGVFGMLYRRSGQYPNPAQASTSPQERATQEQTRQLAQTTCIALGLGAATFVPLTLAIEQASDRQTAMNFATALIMQSVGNVMRDFIVYRFKSVLPPPTLELAMPRLTDRKEEVDARIDRAKRHALSVNIVSYAAILLGTGLLEQHLREQYETWLGKAGNGDFPTFDYWLRSTGINLGIYVFTELLDQWAGQLFANLVQHASGIAPYRNTAARPVARTGVENCCVRLKRGASNGLHATPEVLLDSSTRSVVVGTGAMPFWALRMHVTPQLAQFLRASIGLSEARAFLAQNISPAGLHIRPNSDAINLARDHGPEDLEESDWLTSPAMHDLAELHHAPHRRQPTVYFGGVQINASETSEVDSEEDTTVLVHPVGRHPRNRDGLPSSPVAQQAQEKNPVNHYNA